VPTSRSPVVSRIRQPRRGRPDPGLLRQHCPSSPQPRRRPASVCSVRFSWTGKTGERNFPAETRVIAGALDVASETTLRGQVPRSRTPRCRRSGEHPVAEGRLAARVGPWPAGCLRRSSPAATRTSYGRGPTTAARLRTSSALERCAAVMLCASNSATASRCAPPATILGSASIDPGDLRAKASANEASPRGIPTGRNASPLASPTPRRSQQLWGRLPGPG
jgi:hypothetical protein